MLKTCSLPPGELLNILTCPDSTINSPVYDSPSAKTISPGEIRRGTVRCARKDKRSRRRRAVATKSSETRWILPSQNQLSPQPTFCATSQQKVLTIFAASPYLGRGYSGSKA